MAHKISYRYWTAYLDGLEKNPYKGKMIEQQLPSPIGCDVLTEWDGKSYEMVRLPKDEMRHHFYILGIEGHRATDKNGRPLTTKKVDGVANCCKWE